MLCFSIFKVKKRKGKRNIIVHLLRPGDTVEQLKKYNPPSYLEEFYRRTPFQMTVALCVGEGTNIITRFGKKTVGINIYAPQLQKLRRILPFFGYLIEYLINTFITIRFLRKKQISFFEVHSPSNQIWKSIYVKNFLDIKAITRVVGNYDLIYFSQYFPLFFPFQVKMPFFKIIEYWYDKVLLSYFFKKMDLVFGLNRNNYENAISNGAAPEKSFLGRIKIDREITQYSIISRENLFNYPQEGKILLIWSRLNPEMLVEYALLAMDLIVNRNNHKEIQLVIIGQGSEEKKYKDYVKKKGLENFIHFTGWQNRQYIRSAAHYCDCVISPFGGSALVEAGLLGKPIVAFDIEWQSELIIDGYSGLLSIYNSPEDIKNKIFEILENRDLSKELGENCQLLTRKMFDLEVMEKKEAMIYQKLLFSKQRATLKS